MEEKEKNDNEKREKTKDLQTVLNENIQGTNSIMYTLIAIVTSLSAILVYIKFSRGIDENSKAMLIVNLTGIRNKLNRLANGQEVIIDTDIDRVIEELTHGLYTAFRVDEIKDIKRELAKVGQDVKKAGSMVDRTKKRFEND